MDQLPGCIDNPNGYIMTIDEDASDNLVVSGSMFCPECNIKGTWTADMTLWPEAFKKKFFTLFDNTNMN